MAIAKRTRSNPIEKQPTHREKIVKTITRTIKYNTIIDYEVLDKMLQAGCDGDTLALFFNMTVNAFREKIKKDTGMCITDYAREMKRLGDYKLHTAQYDKALAGSETMLIWLGKNRLKQRENPIDSTITEATIAKSNDIMEQLLKLQHAHAHVYNKENDLLEKVPESDSK